MRQPIEALVACAMLVGCASAPMQPRPERSVPATEMPLERAVPAAETIEQSPPSVLEARRLPLMGGPCPLVFPPRDIGSVLRIPAKMMSSAMDPVMSALCSCTKPGEYSLILARIDFGRGSVVLQAPESKPINQCIETLHVTFAPIPEADLPSSDCINCGPRYYGVFADSPPPPKPTGLKLAYSFFLDRSSEVLNCPATTHAERGECKTNAAATPPIPAKRTCGCSSEDLACAIACAASK